MMHLKITHANLLLILCFVLVVAGQLAMSCEPATYEDEVNAAADDSTFPGYPNGHDTSWGCNLCHAADFLGAGGQPHGDTYTPPEDCTICHQPGGFDYTNPNAPGGHNSADNCLDCHGSQHGQPWTDMNQCLVCHLDGDAAPSSPKGHQTDWDCYLCHARDFNGAKGEPHDAAYTAPTECGTCHAPGDWVYMNSAAADGHGSSQDCLDCHGAEHGKRWGEMSQCFVCHAAGTGGPQFSNLHRTTWNCYVCHQTNFNGTPREPHSGQFSAPAECLTCHAMGSFSNPRHGPRPEDDHQASWNCLSCHGSRHGKPWDDKYQCLLCHQF
jgi:hypothetical protein